MRGISFDGVIASSLRAVARFPIELSNSSAFVPARAAKFCGRTHGNWTAKVEYLFVDLPNGSCTTIGNCGGAAASIVSFNENIIRAGLNFKFGPWW
jgi:hypothetical protein